MENIEKESAWQIEIRKIENGCKVTGKNIEQVFSCDTCNHKNKRNCISLKEIIPEKK